MFFILSKLLHILSMPLIWVFILLLASFFWKKFTKRLRVTAISVLFIFSSPILVQWTSNMWEIPIVTDDQLDDYPMGVVLGGFSSYDTNASRITFRLGGDRLNQSIRLLEMGKIKKLVVSGGSGYLTAPEMREATYVAEYLDQINIPKRKLLFESNSRNTHENATMTAQLLKEQHLDRQPIVLITSAFHMRRAKACFEKAGFTVIPYSSDPMHSEEGFTIEHLLPSAYVLAYWNVLFHEWIGYVSYWMMGYL